MPSAQSDPRCSIALTGAFGLLLTLLGLAGCGGSQGSSECPGGRALCPDFSVQFSTAPVNAGNQSEAGFAIQGGDSDLAYAWEITSDSGDGRVDGTGRMSGSTEEIGGIDLSRLADGELSLSVVLRKDGRMTRARTATALKDTEEPTGHSVSFTTAPVTPANAGAVEFEIAGGETEATFQYSVSSDGGEGTVEGSGTIDDTFETVGGVDLSGLPDGTLTLSVVLVDKFGNTSSPVVARTEKDTSSPADYSATFLTDPINSTNQTAAAFEISGAASGAEYQYTLTSEGGDGNVAGRGTIASTSHRVGGLDVSGLADGRLRLTVEVSDRSGETGPPATAEVTKETGAPDGHSVAFETAPINANNASEASFAISAAETGSNYEYTIRSDGGGSEATGSGEVKSDPETVAGIDLSRLKDGRLTLSLRLTDPAGNTAAAVVDTTVKDTSAPTGHAVEFDTTPINSTVAPSAAFELTGAETGGSFSWEVTSDGGLGTANGSGTVVTDPMTVGGLDLSGLSDGTLTLSVVVEDPVGNEAAPVEDTARKDSTPPAGHSVSWTTAPVDASNDSAAAFEMSSAPQSASYSYEITSDGGAGTVTGTGTIASNPQRVRGIDVSTLRDGQLSVAVTLSDSVGNESAPASDTTRKDTRPPAGYSAEFDAVVVSALDAGSADITIRNPEIGADYAYTVTDSDGTTVSDRGTVGARPQTVTGVDLSGLSDGQLTLEVRLTDDVGNTGTRSIDRVLKDTTNRDPSFTGLPGSASIDEDSSEKIDLSAATFSDRDAGPKDVELELEARAGGTLTVSTSPKLTINGSGSSTVSIVGSASDIDALFADPKAVEYAGPADHFGNDADTLVFTADDRGHTGAGGGGPVEVGEIGIDIAAVNDRPTLSLAGDESMKAGTTITVDNFVTSLDLGPHEGNQSLSDYKVSILNDPNNAIADADIDNNGRLTVKANKANQKQTATIGVRAVDDGGTPNGGNDTSSQKTFDVSVQTCKIPPGKSIAFNYKAGAQSWTVPSDCGGTYRLKVRGAQGGGTAGGKGGYSRGDIQLSAGETLYVYTGEQGGSKHTEDHEPIGAGGGATDIRTKSGSWKKNLKSRIIVAGGGGGSNSDNDNDGVEPGGEGGGKQGGDGRADWGNNGQRGLGASQNSGGGYQGGGTSGRFGIGANAGSESNGGCNGPPSTFNGGGCGDQESGGGGGGWYGGGASESGSAGGSGGGGSGYVGHQRLSNTTTSKGGNAGHGRATITRK